MSTVSINLTEEQLSKVVEAYRTIQEFLATMLSPNELYQTEFIEGLRESEREVNSGKTKVVNSFDDFVS
ncbi:MAG: hypothetical protein HY964_01505 [Ignavibacteriales bacterium]|nr:hypothetical protein [Ignavibacteriales bacterium]